MRPSLALALLTLSAPLTLAGDLAPPSGAVAPTMKPLDDVEPRTAISAENTPHDDNALFKITQPGSYYLTADVTGRLGYHAIEIASSNVSLDLMGFTLHGVPGSLDGVTTDGGAYDNIRITNGTIRGWGGDAIDLTSLNNAHNHHISDIHAVSNAGSGILAEWNAIIESCIAHANGSHGIHCNGGGAVVRACIARNNGATGISPIGFGSTVTQCLAVGNASTGIALSSAAEVVACSAVGNQAHGISAGDVASITRCTSKQNRVNGIQVAGGAIVLDNTCDENGYADGTGAGIYVSQSDCRIEGNNTTNNDSGIHVPGAGNLIVRNAASGNTTDYDIAPGNTVGPIITAATIATDRSPHANYQY